jgi:hypothetical protein
MGFGSFIGGILVGILAVLVLIFGIIVLLGFFKFVPTSFDLPLGIGALIVALLMFAYGWYLYTSAKPKGTLNVHNQ